jgi:hypothetical protein
MDIDIDIDMDRGKARSKPRLSAALITPFCSSWLAMTSKSGSSSNSLSRVESVSSGSICWQFNSRSVLMVLSFIAISPLRINMIFLILQAP